MSDMNLYEPNQNPNQGSNPNQYPNSYQPETPKKPGGMGPKGLVALVIACALLFTAVGFGGGWIWRHNMQGSQTASADSSTTGEDSTPTSDELALRMAQTEDGALTTPEIVEKTADSVVEITTETVQTGTMLQQYISSGAGSGVIVTEDGYIITNHHVIENATSITVTLHNGESYPATLVGLDNQLDVALLKIEASGLTPASIGTSSDLLVGQTVVAIGNPLGQLGGTVTQGILSAKDRNITLDGETMTLLQTDAAVNPGNSGGGLFDAQGNLIGLVVAKSSGDDVEGLGFAIPIDNVVEVLDDLKEYGYVTGRVSLGVTLIDINTDQMAWMYRVSEMGTYIYSMTKGSAADEAGLQPGDRIISVNGTDIESIDDLKALLENVSVGDSLQFEISRSGQTMTLEVIAGEEVPDEIQNQTNPTGYSTQSSAGSGSSL